MQSFVITVLLATNIEPFNEMVEDFETYVSMFQLFLLVNDVVSTKRVLIFLTLTLICDKYFTLLKNLLLPKLLETCELE